ncbi:MAG: UxaA family hydrolase [Sedimentisphaerales bacterium]|nr:UxaA family hydrolase [Sedimentisphaerales bacterium]
MRLRGYRRAGGRLGIRNHFVVLSSVCCANSFVEQIGLLDRNLVPMIHQHGCTHLGNDKDQVLRTLAGVCNNPNVGGILLVGLGCETIGVDQIESAIETENKIVRHIIIQDIGRRDKVIDRAKEHIQEIKAYLSNQPLEEFDLSDLVVGLECGGSDPFSGITANPAVGLVSDRLVESGATVILAETPELIGAEDALSERIQQQDVKDKLFSRINEYVKASRYCGCDMLGANPTPGNIRSGLSSIEEKSLGCIAKGGRSFIQEFVEYADRPKSRGLVIMDTPGNDPESVTGMVAGGAQVILFTTGLGTPLGHPVTPVIKIASNNKVFSHMNDYMDINAGSVIGGEALSDIAERIFEFLLRVCNGVKTCSERNGCREFAMNRIGPTF